MKNTTIYETVTAWLYSCKTQEQINTCTDFIHNRLIVDDKTMDDIKAVAAKYMIQRGWVCSKYAISKQRFPATDEQIEPPKVIIYDPFSDIIEH